MKEMVGGCCVCSDERGWPENPLVYCDGQNCTVAVHQACYGIVTVPTGPWYCRKCESQERPARVRCELCPSRDGALKRTDNQGWAHVVCALYIPEVRFGNVSTMEPIILQLIPQERYSKTCYICADAGKASKSTSGACMQCNKSGCRQQFHVTCAQQLGLLCEEAGNYLDNVKYCGYCQHHYSKLKKGGNVKPIPPYKPISHDTNSSDSPSSPEKDELHAQRASINRPGETQPTASISSSSSSSSSSKQKKSSSSSGGNTNKNSSSNSQIPYTSGANATTNAVNATSTGGSGGSGSGSTRTSSSSKEKEKDKESKHSSSSGSSSSSKNVNKISSSTNNKHDKDQSSYSSSSYSASSSSSRDKNKSSSSSSSSSKNNNNSQNSSNKDDGVSSNSHSSKSSSSQFSSSTSSSSTSIRITTSSATPTSPISTIIHKHDSSNSANSSSKDNIVQSGNSSILSPSTLSSQTQNLLNDDKTTTSIGSWHHQSNNSKISSSYPSSGLNADALNNDNDANKTNYNAMTKKRKAMHQANSSNRNSADESSNKEVCKDLSVKVVPLDKLDPSVSEFERHYKKARTDINSQATPAAVATSSPPEPNIQNVNPNVIHSTGSAATVVNNSTTATVPTSSPATSPTNNKSQVIQHGLLASKKDERQQQQQQAESLVVSVPLSSATVPGIPLPTNSISNNSSVSTIVNANQTLTTSTASSIHQGTLYQHLTNSQTANQRASPHIQQPIGRASPITSTPSSLANDISSHSANNHTSVLQNMNSSVNSGSVISSTGFQHAEPIKVSFEKQTPRIQAIQQEETSRRSRSQTHDNKKGKKRNITESSTSSSSSSSNRTAHTKTSTSHARNHSKTNKPNTKNIKMIIDDNFGDGNNLSINSAGCTGPSVVHSSSSTTNNNSSTHTTSAQSTIVKLTPAPTSSGSARTSSPVVNVSAMKKFSRDEPSTSRTPDMPPFHSVASSLIANSKFASYEQQSTTPAGLVINTNVQTLKESPPSSPGSETSAKKRRKQINSTTPQPSPHGFTSDSNKDKESKIVLQNGAIPVTTSHHMLGNSLNPMSSVAKNMADTLHMEIESHMLNSGETTISSNFIGPQYPGRKDSTKSTSSSTTTISGPASLTSMLSGTTSANGTPQSLEQLLERQWEQGSQFLMEQAQHFDIASLLSCLHQLKIENSRLEDHINSLVSRRDHLLAVNARLAIPLGQQQQQQQQIQQQQQQPQTVTVNNGPQIEAQPAPQPTNITNKRPTPANPVATIQISPMENGQDNYRGHNQPQTSTQSSSSNIRHSTTVVKGGGATHLVTIDTPNTNSQHPQQHQFHSNAQFQQVFQQQSHVNSARGRQGNSFQTQAVPSGFPSVHKSKN